MNRKKTHWVLPAASSSKQQKEYYNFQQEALREFAGLSEIGLQVLWRRDFRSIEAVDELLRTDESRLKQAIEELPGCKEAAKKVSQAVKEGRQILIYGDYDVDGVCATAILWRYLYWEMDYKQVRPIIPNRYTEGYGINADRLKSELDNYKDQQVLLITVDCGIKDAAHLAQISKKRKNLEVIITDHHLPPQLPEGAILRSSDVLEKGQLLVHPQLDGKYQWPEICAGVISWMLVSHLRSIDSPTKLELKSIQSLELAALATVCDQMSLLGINRDIVRLGIKQLKSSDNEGLKALAKVSGTSLNSAGVYEFGYVIGPRINAAGRMEDATTALQLLCTRSPQKASELAAQLNELNIQRQNHTQAALEEMAGIPVSAAAAILTNPEWKEGIVGLIAGKLQEATGLPSLVATQNHEGNWVGSARSSSGVNITELISSQADLLIKFGGHAQAAGFTVSAENLEKFKQGILSQAGQLPESVFTITSEIDFVISQEMITFEQIKGLELLEPFGQGFASPKLLLPQVKIDKYRQFGREGKHLAAPKFYQNGAFELIWFNHRIELSGIETKQHSFVGHLGYNEWRGQITPQFKIMDVFEDA